MWHILITIFISLLILVGSPSVVWAHDWSRIIARTIPSVVLIHQGDTTCSAFSIDQKRGYYLTANHCTINDEIPPLIGIYTTTIEFQDEALDITVLKSTIHKPALQPRDSSYRSGLEFGMLGFAYGLPAPLFKAGIVSSTVMIFMGTPKNFFDQDATAGMSGGPIFDTNGHVLGVITGGNGHFGVASAIANIYEATKKFWSWKPFPPLTNNFPVFP